MSTIIKLPAGTEKIPVSEISSLLACAEGTVSLLIDLEKKVASSKQTLQLNDGDVRRLIKIWGIEADLNVLFRITKEEWLEREVTFNNTGNISDWSLVPIWAEFPNAIKERKIQQQLVQNITKGQGDIKLTIRDPITNAPTMDLAPDAFVTIEEFIRYAHIVHLAEVQVEIEPETTDDVEQPWASTARSLANDYIADWRSRGYEPTVEDAALYVEGKFIDMEIYSKHREVLDRATIKRDALKGITGHPKGYKAKKPLVPIGRKGELPKE